MSCKEGWGEAGTSSRGPFAQWLHQFPLSVFYGQNGQNQKVHRSKKPRNQETATNSQKAKVKTGKYFGNFLFIFSLIFYPENREFWEFKAKYSFGFNNYLE